MILYINKNGEIKDVDSTNDSELIEVRIEDDEDNPFLNRTTAEICCYKVKVNNGKISSFVPYVDSRIIEQIARLGKENEELKRANMSTQAQVDYVTMMSDIEI